VSPHLDVVERNFSVRQRWDWKASADRSRMTEHWLLTYTRACAWSLARSHARSGDRLAIAAYLGKGNRCDRALARFAEVYADQNDADYRRLVEAEAAGEVQATRGIAPPRRSVRAQPRLLRPAAPSRRSPACARAPAGGRATARSRTRR